jgi:maltose alpha-D-glucosyltransferase/alpha-amylase
MAELAESWRQHAVDGFRAAYRKAMRGCLSYPANKKQARDLTRFFMLEGWVYAARRELAERPLWVDIPLQGILDIVNRKG